MRPSGARVGWPGQARMPTVFSAEVLLTSTGTRVIRGHLSLAYAPPREPRAPPRSALVLRGTWASIRVFCLNLLAFAGTVVALAPLAFRRGPMGHRTQVPRMTARVIAFQARRRASPP